MLEEAVLGILDAVSLFPVVLRKGGLRKEAKVFTIHTASHCKPGPLRAVRKAENDTNTRRCCMYLLKHTVLTPCACMLPYGFRIFFPTCRNLKKGSAKGRVRSPELRPTLALSAHPFARQDVEGAP